ncbi:MAG: MarR family winged helix-turn-helix transcriptional regulator [Bacteroidia bacterium]
METTNLTILFFYLEPTFNQKSMSNENQLERLEATLYQLNELIQRHQEIALRRFKLSAVDVEILRFLDAEGDKKMKNVGDHVDVKLSNLTNIIDTLEDLKMVRRVNSKTDRRSIYVSITPKGKQRIGEYNVFLRQLTERMTTGVQEEQFGIMLESLEKISQVILTAPVEGE